MLTADLVSVPSPSFSEGPITDIIEKELRRVVHLDTVRIGDNLVARTDLGRRWRLVLAGHTDTVPANGNADARIDGDVLWGVGSADMKGGLAVMLSLAIAAEQPAVDVTYVFYAREEVDSAHNGLKEIAATRPDLLSADVALLAEPTDAIVEAGCQGTMRLKVTLLGERAHTARAWMGRNAVHRLRDVLGVISDYEPRRPVISGCEFREGLQAVAVEGGVAGNVVPDEATLMINHRFAPDRTIQQAERHIRELLAPVLDAEDALELVDAAPPADPGLEHSLIQALVRSTRSPPRAKLGWTDAAFFAGAGNTGVEFRSRRPAAGSQPSRTSASQLFASRVQGIGGSAGGHQFVSSLENLTLTG